MSAACVIGLTSFTSRPTRDAESISCALRPLNSLSFGMSDGFHRNTERVLVGRMPRSTGIKYKPISSRCRSGNGAFGIAPGLFRHHNV
jgi:hypothetical protein